MLLPPCPLRLQSSFIWKNSVGGWMLLLIGIGASVGYALWQHQSFRELIDQTEIWRAGVPALGCEVNGNVTTNHFIFRDYNLTVRYRDAHGGTHQGELKFDTLEGEVDQSREPAVHYLASDPDRFALSWAMDVRAGRWASFLFMAIVGIGLVGGSFSCLGWLTLRRLANARRCATRSDEVIVRITRIKPQIVNGQHTGDQFSFSGRTTDGREVTGKIGFPKKHRPLYADQSLQTMVALVPPENARNVVVLRDDFYPFLLTADEQAQAREMIARSVPASR